MILDKLKSINPKFIDRRNLNEIIRNQAQSEKDKIDKELKITINEDERKRLKNSSYLYRIVIALQETLIPTLNLTEEIENFYGTDFKLEDGESFQASVKRPLELINKTIFKYNENNFKFVKNKTGQLALNIEADDVRAIESIKNESIELIEKVVNIYKNLSQNKLNVEELETYFKTILEEMKDIKNSTKKLSILKSNNQEMFLSVKNAYLSLTEMLKKLKSNIKDISSYVEFKKNNENLIKQIKAIKTSISKSKKDLITFLKDLIDLEIEKNSTKLVLSKYIEDYSENIPKLEELKNSIFQNTFNEELKGESLTIINNLRLEIEELQKDLVKMVDENKIEESKLKDFEKIFEIFRKIEQHNLKFFNNISINLGI